jgi:hypothetical protein
MFAFMLSRVGLNAFSNVKEKNSSRKIDACAYVERLN